MTKEECQHDYEHPLRIGRCNYRCRNCGADISLQVILIAEAETYSDEIDD